VSWAAKLRGCEPWSRPTSTVESVALVRREELVAEAGDSSGTQRKVYLCLWKPLPSNG
jgi:hypothetical protein